MPDISPPLTNRSYLFAPGSSSRILGKVLDAGADAVILDLEDAVAPDGKDAARMAVGALIRDRAATATAEIYVRVNVREGRVDETDLHATCGPGMTGIVLPKVEGPATVLEASKMLAEIEAAQGLPVGSISIVPTIETAIGVLETRTICRADERVIAVTVGGVDLIDDLGGRGDAHGPATAYARQHVVLAARAAGLSSIIDTVYTRLTDLEGLRAATEEAATLGYFGKLVLHPRQLEVVHRVFTPSAEAIESAQQIVDSAELAGREGRAALVVDGAFIDPPVVARAMQTIRLAQRLGDSG